MPRGGWFWYGLFLILVLLPISDPSPYLLSVCVLGAIYVAVNLMWSLVLGTAGVYSFATLAIVGLAAYMAAWLSAEHGVPWPLATVAAAVVGALAGLIVALPGLRLRGVYFALFTLGIIELCSTLIGQSEELGGAFGIAGADQLVPASETGTQAGAYLAYGAGLVLVLLALLVYRLVAGGRLGLLLRTAREAEPVAQGLGIDVARSRLAVFTISSAMLGIAGGFYTAYYGTVSPALFDFDTLMLLFAMIVVGGIDSARGVVIGTALLLFIDERLVSLGAWRLVILGALMLLVTLFANRGLAGIPAQVRAHLARRKEIQDDNRPDLERPVRVA